MIRICLYAFVTFSIFFSCKTKAPVMDADGVVMTSTQEDGRLKVLMNGVEVWAHQYATMPAPEGVNPLFARSGFNHPVQTPTGKLLTWIQAPDHYHHYGIWNPWTHVLYDGDTLDFWNLYKNEGTVRWSSFRNIESGKKKVSYEAVHQHIRLKGSEELALEEVQKISVEAVDKSSYLVSFESTYRCPAKKDFKILEYRYAGFGWRCTAEWNKDNSSVLTSAMINRKEADGTRAKWMLVQGSLGDGKGGILMMSDPSNYNHLPGDGEPIRIWPETSNGRGDLFANFSPTKNMDWLLQPGKDYKLSYKLLVFDGNYDFKKADEVYNRYIIKH